MDEAIDFFVLEAPGAVLVEVLDELWKVRGIFDNQFRGSDLEIGAT